MARCTTPFNSGSRCPSATAALESNAPATRKPVRMLLSSHARADEVECIVEREFLALRVTPAAVLELARFQPTLSDNQAVRDAQQLCVGELDSRTGVAVVVQHFNSSSSKLGIEPLGDLAYPFGFLHAHGHEHNLEGRNGIRPDDAAFIVILLNRRGHDARHTDAVTTHVEAHFLAAFVENDAFHGLAVLLTQLEDVTYFNTAGNLETSMTRGARVAFYHVADVSRDHSLHVAVPVDAGVVHVSFIGPGHEVSQHQLAVINIDPALESNRADVTGHCIG